MADDIEDIGITGRAQRDAWLAKVLPPVEQLRSDLWSIPVVIPHSPLRYTSVYVLAGEAGLTLIDTGSNSPDGWRALTEGLTVLGATVADVTDCLVTHFHYDHLGLASRLQSEVGARIGLHRADFEVSTAPTYADEALGRAEITRWFTHLGAPAADAARLAELLSLPGPGSIVARPDLFVADGDKIELDGWTVLAVHTPGHTPGHLCFYDEGSRSLFAGDHVLPRISPNIPADHADGDPLGDYLRSLARIREIDADEVLPAHEWRFADLAARVDQLQRHHERRLAELLAVVRAHPRSVPWQLAGELSWSRPWSRYDGHMRMAAVGEATAHLRHLVRRGQVLVSDEAVPRYVAADPDRPPSWKVSA